MSAMLLNVLEDSICIRLTETLLHFLWQGLAIGLCTLALVRLCRTATARTRYAIHAASLALMALCLPVAFALTHAPEPRQIELVTVSVAEPALSDSVGAPEPISSAPSAEARVVMDRAPSMQTAEVGSAFPVVVPVQEPAAEIAITPAASESLFEHAIRSASPYAAGAYLLGVVLMLVRLCSALWGGHRLRRCAVPICDPWLLSQIRRQAARIGLKVVPVVAYCERITIPAVAGILRPMILLPCGLAADLDIEQLLAILAHEMAHIRRFDLLVNLLQRFVETVLFFHPAVWYVSRQLSFERENCCDDAVVQAGYESLQYADTLVRMAELCAATGRPMPSALQRLRGIGHSGVRHATLAAGGEGGSQLKRRVRRLLAGEQRLRLTRADSLTLVLVAGLLAGTMAGVWGHASAAPGNDLDKNGTQVSDKAANTNATSLGERGGVSPPVDPALAHDVEFAGRVVDVGGKPVAGAEIWLAAPPKDPDDPAPRGIVRQMARSDEKGNFSFRHEPVKSERIEPATWTHSLQVTAKAAGYGCYGLPLAAFEENPVASAKRDELQQWLDKRLGAGRFAGRTLKLPPEAGPVRGRLLDLEGRALANVMVSIEDIDNPDPALLDQAFEQNSKDVFYQALNAHRAWTSMTRDQWQALVPSVKTNEDGEFSLRGLGRDQMATVTFSREGVAAERLFILGKEMETKHLPHIRPGGAMDVYVGTRFTHTVGPAVPVSGVVTEFQSGKPIAGAAVFVERLFGRDATMKGPGKLRLWTNHIRTVTDDQGRYRLVGIPAGEAHVLNVIAPKSEPWLIAQQVFSLDPDQTSAKVNVQVFRGIWLEGRVTDAATGEPVPGHVDYLALQKNPNIPQKFGLHDDWQMDRFPIDESGHYRVAGLPGPGVLLVRSFGKRVYPRCVGAEKVDGYEPGRSYLPTTPTGMPLENWHRIEPIDPPVDAASHTLDLTLSAGTSPVGRVLGPGGAPVANVEALGQEEKGGFFSDVAGGKFTVFNYDPAVPRDLFFKANGNSLVGHLHLEGAPPAELVVTLQPAVTVHGRLIETETGDEAVGYDVHCDSSKKGKFRIDGVITDKNGRFEIKGLLAGNVFKMDASNPQRFVNGKNGFTIDLTKARPGDVLELGDVTGKNAKSARE
jgi:protocatechuate 3,4-dioxygenase beta subunit